MTKQNLKTLFISAVAIITLALSSHATATDRDKEKRWAEQIADTLLDGEAVYLNDANSKFLAIDTRADNPKDTAVIVIHGIGIHPDWETVVRPLRVELAAKGWNTLSLQMPVLGNEATGKDYEPLMKEAPARIDAGIRYLSTHGVKKVVIVAHSLGAQMASYYLAHKKLYRESQTKTPIVGYVGIGMGAGNSIYLEKIKIPVLDLYGEKDLPNVLASATARAKAANKNKKYKQQKVKDATHFFEEKDDELVKAVESALRMF